jgi:hypothetical protein
MKWVLPKPWNLLRETERTMKILSQDSRYLILFVCLFVCSLLSNPLSKSDYITSNDMTVYNVRERICKEVVAICCKVLSQHLLRWLMKNTGNLGEESWYPGPDSNWAPNKYKSETLPSV